MHPGPVMITRSCKPLGHNQKRETLPDLEGQKWDTEHHVLLGKINKQTMKFFIESYGTNKSELHIKCGRPGEIAFS